LTVGCRDLPMAAANKLKLLAKLRFYLIMKYEIQVLAAQSRSVALCVLSPKA
jgi:hypothetical protein